MQRIGLMIGCLFCAGLTGCGQPAAPQPADSVAVVGSQKSEIGEQRPAGKNHQADLRPPTSDLRSATPEKLPVAHLPNAYRVTENIISGGLPEGDAAFQELEDLGIKTVISVDGMTPDVETARRHGLRYVHLPHGYDSVPVQRGHELAKALRELPGPVYIHCHHGKHRSPSATAVACVEAGLITPDSAESILKAAGTSENYRGLYASARAARPQDPAFLDGLAVEFQEVAAIPPMADAMVGLEHTHDHLKQIAAAEWKAPPKHPDLDPTHEALLLKEHFAELQRMDETATKPDSFREYLSTSEAAAQQLEDALSATPPAIDTAKAAFDAVTANCTACHKEYRDNL